MAEQDKKVRKIRYQNRKTSILKKSKELSTLCDVKLCVVIVSPDGKLETWPDNLNDVKAVLSAVKESRKPIRSENPREKSGSGDRSRLCSRIKIPTSDKGKEIDIENCGFGNNAADVVEDNVLYAVSGADQENNNAQMDNDFGMSVVDMGVNQAPTFSSSYYGNGNGNGESNCEGFGNFIGDMVTNQGESNLGYYDCGSYHHQQNESGSSSSFAMNPKTHFSNLQQNQEPCDPDHCYGRRYHHDEYEMGSSTGLNFSYQDPTSIAYHQEQHDSTGVNNNFCNTVQPSSSLAYEQYEFGIWEWQQ